jgi:hypothetical protein
LPKDRDKMVNVPLLTSGSIAAECAVIDERGGAGIWPKAAAAIVRQDGSNSPAAPAETDAPATKPPVL